MKKRIPALALAICLVLIPIPVSSAVFPYQLYGPYTDINEWTPPKEVLAEAEWMVVEYEGELGKYCAFMRYDGSDWTQYSCWEDNGGRIMSQKGKFLFNMKGLEGGTVGFAAWGDDDPQKIIRVYLESASYYPGQPSDPEPSGPEPPGGPLSEYTLKAINAGLVPERLQNNYAADITRGEFCALAVAAYERYTLRSIITISPPFPDTADLDVLKMAGLNVVQGVGNGRFDPNGVFTRQQAAVFLLNLLDAMGFIVERVPASFTDANQIAWWARDYVGTVQSIGLVKGTGTGGFDPKGRFTRQQAMTMIWNLWEWSLAVAGQ